jgi:hypothetical protein
VSAPMVLNARQLRLLADALDGLTAVRKDTRVTLDTFAPLDLTVGDVSIRARWDDESKEFIVDDRVGS